VQGGRKVSSLGARGGEKAPLAGGVDPTGRTRKFRLAELPPVVLTCAPLSTTSAFLDVSVLRAC